LRQNGGIYANNDLQIANNDLFSAGRFLINKRPTAFDRKNFTFGVHVLEETMCRAREKGRGSHLLWEKPAKFAALTLG